MTNEQTEFIPFHALNEFMRPDYRLAVVRTALTALPTLPSSFRAPIDKMTKLVVRVPGFRNGVQAPTQMKIAPIAAAFEKSPELVAAILNAWAETQKELRQKVYDLLKSREWELLPPEADRSKLPGFSTTWKKGEDFEVINKAFSEMYPDYTATMDDVSLMTVWLSGRLPIHANEEDDVPEVKTE